MTEHINDRPEEQAFVDEAAAGAAAEEERHDAVDGPEPQRKGSDQLGQNLRKAAEETAYATVGFVSLVADKAKDFYEDQKQQYADTHPGADADQAARNFLSQMKVQLDKLIDDVNRGFRDMAERGRATRSTAGETSEPVDVVEESVTDVTDDKPDYDS